jgi:hypothetical protein
MIRRNKTNKGMWRLKGVISFGVCGDENGAAAGIWLRRRSGEVGVHPMALPAVGL